MPTAPGSTDTASEPLQTRIVRVPLKSLRTLTAEENARFLPAAQHRQLVANLKADGVLTSAPLVYKGLVVSGNHRVRAAIEAGILEADVIEVLGEITRERMVAIQLSHNAISGEDDPGILKRLYEELDLVWKKYSALTDNMLKALPEIDLKGIGMGAQTWHELRVTFLPEDLEALGTDRARIEKGFADIEKAKKEGKFAWVARAADFDLVFDTIVKVKGARRVFNTALALRIMAELSLQKLAELAGEPDGP